MVYQLDFNPEGISHREEYLQMFRDCGWEYLQEYMGYSYFRKPVSRMEGRDEEIFCDDASRLDMMKRVFKAGCFRRLSCFCSSWCQTFCPPPLISPRIARCPPFSLRRC